MIVRLDKSAILITAKDVSAAIGVEGDAPAHPVKISEVEKIVGNAKRKVQEQGVPGVGVSGSNSGKGHDPQHAGETDLVFRNDLEMEKVEEESVQIEEEDEDEAEVDSNGAPLVSESAGVELSLPTGPPKPTG
jgi:protein phosphatase PTC1